MLGESKEETRYRAVVIMTLTALTFSLIGVWYSIDWLTRPGSPTPDERIEAAVVSMANSVTVDGLYDYEVDLLRGVPVPSAPEEQTVRQAGANVALAEYLYFVDRDDSRATAALRTVLDTLWRTSQEWNGARFVQTPGHPVWIAPSGATALALLAAVYYGEATGDRTFSEAIESWKRALLSIRRPGKGFRAFPEADAEDAFYNGEAWLALAAYHRFRPSPETAELLTDLAAYFTTRYPALDTEFFHWGVPAAALSIESGVANDRLKPWIESQARDGLADLERYPLEGRRWNTCTFALGLMYGLPFLEGDLAERVRAAIDVMQARNRKAQVVGRLTPEAPIADAYAKYSGGFLGELHGVSLRIDNTHHCLSAMIAERRLRR